MFWFCGVNDNSDMHKNMYLVALKSANKNTTLKPILLYDGNDQNFMRNVELNKSKLVRHKTLSSEKESYKAKPEDWKNIASGAFLRIDIPKVCEQLNITDDYVLYTDTDVLFLQDVVEEFSKYNPTFFAVAPESNKNEHFYFNSGVMLINLKNMLGSYDHFSWFMDIHKFNFQAYDQGALQWYYKGKVDILPLYLNHKPYWGNDPSAKIIHFHGPKPRDITGYLNGEKYEPTYHFLYKRVDNDTWKYFLKLYEDFESLSP